MPHEWTLTGRLTVDTAPGPHQTTRILMPSAPSPEDVQRDASRGARICETCFDAMTDLVLSGEWTATGLEEACCAGCWPYSRVPIHDPRLYGRLRPGAVHQGEDDGRVYFVTSRGLVEHRGGHTAFGAESIEPSGSPAAPEWIRHATP